MLEMSHSEVVSLIQGLPIDFRLVVARKRDLLDGELPIAAEAETEVESEPNDFERQGALSQASIDKNLVLSTELIMSIDHRTGILTGYEILA